MVSRLLEKLKFSYEITFCMIMVLFQVDSMPISQDHQNLIKRFQLIKKHMSYGVQKGLLEFEQMCFTLFFEETR